ncbi:hypothetical protein RJ640_011641 [Escallonia rubra]|uniref:EDS1 EP domain-containing protein n=1 Tax=Escallonia rubra TaxID=112253 RepID=A0AA88QRB1_9ASTE|nr:hypothetical protein RJ640_011641 [Escallonia rubra]
MQSEKDRQVVFTGHSSAGPTAIFATLHFLRERGRKRKKKIRTATEVLIARLSDPHLLEAGSSHTLFIEKTGHAISFVLLRGRYEFVPRILLAPLSSIHQDEVQRVLDCFNPMSKNFRKEFVAKSNEATAVHTTITTYAASAASHAACNLMGSTNLVLDTLRSFIELSPHRPFGTYIICIEHGKLVVVENSDTVVQMLFHLACEAEVAQVAYRSLKDNFVYENELQNCFESTRARLCIYAAEELEKKKLENEKKIDKLGIKDGLQKMQEYRKDGERRKVGHYDSFKLQNEEKDFQANTTCGASRYRQLRTTVVHAKNEDSGSYMEKGRPKRYRFTQRWREHEEGMPAEHISESCFLAEVEELKITCKKRSFKDIKDRISSLEKQVQGWVQAMPEVLGKDVFLDGSTFAKWWIEFTPPTA